MSYARVEENFPDPYYQQNGSNSQTQEASQQTRRALYTQSKVYNIMAITSAALCIGSAISVAFTKDWGKQKKRFGLAVALAIPMFMFGYKGTQSFKAAQNA